MNKIKASSIDMIKVFGCLIFDIAIILAFFRVVGLFLIMSPVKSVISFFILCIGLVILNGAIILLRFMYKNIGMPYTVSIVILSVVYFCVSNIPFIFFIPLATAWYMVYELIILATFLVIFSIILLFSKTQIKYSKEFRVEKNNKDIIIKNEDN